MSKEEIAQAILAARKRVAKKLLNDKPKFIEFTNRGRSKRLAVRVFNTSYYALKDPEDNHTIRHLTKSELIAEISEGTGDFFGLQ